MADPAAFLPRDGIERTAMLALRYVAAAAETGDAACFDAAFEGAEATLGPRGGALLVARAAALVRALRRDDADLRFLPPPCRYLSPGEAHILDALRSRLPGGLGACPAELSAAARAALADLASPLRTEARRAACSLAQFKTADRTSSESVTVPVSMPSKLSAPGMIALERAAPGL